MLPNRRYVWAHNKSKVNLLSAVKLTKIVWQTQQEMNEQYGGSGNVDNHCYK